MMSFIPKMSDNLKIRQTMQAVLKPGCLTIALALAGCATAPVYTSQDVALAAQQNQLEMLFKQVQADLAEAKPGTDKALALDTVHNDIAQKLAKPHQVIIDDLMLQAADGPLSLAQISQLDTEVDTVKEWLPYDNPPLRKAVDAARQQTRGQIERVNAQLEDLPAEQIGKRNLLLVELADLTGGEHGEKLRKQAGDELETTYQQGVAALEGLQLSTADTLLREVAVADPEYKDIVFQQELIATGLFEQRFWQALVDAHPDEAYELFYDFAETPAFATHRNKIAKDAAELAEYFDAVGDKQMRQKQWLESYRAFARAAYIRSRLEIEAQPGTAVQRFTLEMENRYKRADKAGKTQVALAYLSIIQSLYPQHPLVELKQGESFTSVHDQAVVKLGVEPFSGPYGRQMGTAISNYLLEKVPNEMQLVSAAQLQSMGDNKTGHAYLLVAGEMLRTEVETREQLRNETRAVAIATEPGPNPLYRAWRQLPRAERKQTPEPAETVDLPILEDLVISHRDITNTAVLEASYRVIEPGSANEVSAETITESLSATATATPGMQRGEYVLQAEAARLPAEAEMFDQLISQVSSQIGDKLAERWLTLDDRYAAAAREQARQGNLSAATELWAYAFAVSQEQSEQQREYRTAMQEAVLQI
jgi:hypothetical protein